MQTLTPQLPTNRISVFTDGSCHVEKRVGGWAAIIFRAGEKTVLSGHVFDTTHQRMELTAALSALQHLETISAHDEIVVYTDSQYLADLHRRKKRLLASAFTTRKKLTMPNADLLAEFFRFDDKFKLECVKVPSHAKGSSQANHNREVDMMSRSIVRKLVTAAHNPGAHV